MSLEPCPFCGEIPKTKVQFRRSDGGEYRMAAVIQCECGTSKSISIYGSDDTPFEVFTDTFDAVTELWNRRSYEKEQTPLGKCEQDAVRI